MVECLKVIKHQAVGYILEAEYCVHVRAYSECWLADPNLMRQWDKIRRCKVEGQNQAEQFNGTTQSRARRRRRDEPMLDGGFFLLLRIWVPLDDLPGSWRVCENSVLHTDGHR